MTIERADILEIIALSDHEWRVCDGRIAPSDPSRILGYIERCPDGFEVLSLCPGPFSCGSFPRWNSALAALLEKSRHPGIPPA